MELSPETARELRNWLEEDPVANAHLIYRGFYAPEESDVVVDNASRPRAVVIHQKDWNRLTLAAEDAPKAAALLESLPPKEYGFSSVDLELLPALREVADVETVEPVWLFKMDRSDFRPYKVCDTEPVRVEHSGLIAEQWEPERNAQEYVRSRIERGPSQAVYVNGDIVAWDMTHFETDKVVMLGFLHVMESYRGRGYAKTVCTAMCEGVFDQGKTPACQVFEDNEPSLRLTERMGFRKVKRQAWGRVAIPRSMRQTKSFYRKGRMRPRRERGALEATR